MFVALDDGGGDADGDGCLVGLSDSAFGFAVFGFADAVVLVVEDDDEATPKAKSASANCKVNRKCWISTGAKIF